MSKNNDNTVDIDTTVDDITNDIGKVDISDSDVPDICANCGKEGASNTCNKCKMVKYCNAACKKKHRKKHKKGCEEHIRRVAELQEEEIKRAAKLYDEKLFKPPPQPDNDCPICFLHLPILSTGRRYKSCCGKMICSGCIYAMEKSTNLCPFCRTSTPTTFEESNKRLQKRVDVGDGQAMSILGDFFSEGTRGFPQDYTKALELWHQAIELGCADSIHKIGQLYYRGEGMEKDTKKAKHYWERGAMRGCVGGRHNLGVLEQHGGNTERALKHYMISNECGHHASLTNIQLLYMSGRASKDIYTKALRAYQKHLDEVKSSQRDEAAAFDDKYNYIG